MAYVDPQFNVSVEKLVAFGATGTSTASATDNALASVFRLPKFKRAQKVIGIRVPVATAPASNLTGLSLVFLNGTSTFGVVAVTTNTAGAVLDATMTTANAVFATDAQPSVKALATATASGQSIGTFDIWFEVQPKF